jgi:hypothetical protein
MANIERRGGYTPRRVRERRAYQFGVTAAVTGLAGIVGLVLAIAGVWGAGWPIILLIVAALCVLGFRRAVSGR